MNHYIYIKTKTKNKNKILMKLYKNNINVYDIEEKNNYLYLKILHDDFENVQDKIIASKFYYVKDSGVYHLKNVITPLKLFCIILFLFFTNFFSNIIVDVEVIHSNKEIRELIKSNLNDYNIRNGSLKKSFEEIEEIKTDILNKYKDKIEWLEIENIGMKYIVRIEERIINTPQNESSHCHIVASKSGIIKSIIATKGEIQVLENQYVKENDILISGIIKFNEEVKNNVCANGSVLAEVWYYTTVHLPINYQETNRTSKKRYNLMIETGKGKYKIFNSRLENYETEEKKLFHLFNLTFYRLDEYEINVIDKKYDIDSGVERALFLGDEKMNIKLKDNESIKSRKVLKKNINDSTIDVEIFYVVIEDITKQVEYEEELVEEGS